MPPLQNNATGGTTPASVNGDFYTIFTVDGSSADYDFATGTPGAGVTLLHGGTVRFNSTTQAWDYTAPSTTIPTVNTPGRSEDSTAIATTAFVKSAQPESYQRGLTTGSQGPGGINVWTNFSSVFQTYPGGDARLQTDISVIEWNGMGFDLKKAGIVELTVECDLEALATNPFFYSFSVKWTADGADILPIRAPLRREDAGSSVTEDISRTVQYQKTTTGSTVVLNPQFRINTAGTGLMRAVDGFVARARMIRIDED